MPMREVLASFWRDWDRLSPQQQRAFREAVAQFIADIADGGQSFHPRLRVKRVQGHRGVWEMTWALVGSASLVRRLRASTVYFVMEAPYPHRVDGQEVACDDTLGLRAQERPGRTLFAASPRRSLRERDLLAFQPEATARRCERLERRRLACARDRRAA